MIDESLERLHEQYRNSFKEKAQNLSTLSFDVADRGGEALRAALHKIAGSSGLYGYDDLHELCAQAEKAPDSELVLKSELVIDWLRRKASTS